MLLLKRRNRCRGSSAVELAEGTRQPARVRTGDVDRRGAAGRLKVFKYLRAQQLKVTRFALVPVRAHGKLSVDDSLHGPLNVRYSRLHRIVINGHLDALIVLQKVDGPRARVFA